MLDQDEVTEKNQNQNYYAKKILNVKIQLSIRGTTQQDQVIVEGVFMNTTDIIHDSCA